MNIVMLGAPGTGKGTVAKVLAKRLGMPHISTGDMFREQIKNGTELGKEANDYISKGLLVPDELTIRIVKDRLSQPDTESGVILDGFPRTLEQAKELSKIILLVQIYSSKKRKVYFACFTAKAQSNFIKKYCKSAKYWR